MKLSKAQQEVVDKMREGWELRLREPDFPYLHHGGSINVNRSTFKALKYRSIIERCGTYINGYVYRLTEQYKNERK